LYTLHGVTEKISQTVLSSSTKLDRFPAVR